MIATTDSQRLQEVAAVLASLDALTCEEVLACFSPEERETLVTFMQSIEWAGDQPTHALVIELLHALRRPSPESAQLNTDGIDLASVAGRERSDAWDRGSDLSEAATTPDPLEQFLANIPVRPLIELLEAQHPQLAAATLTLLPRQRAKLVLQEVAETQQDEWSARLNRCEGLHPDIARELRCELANRLASSDAEQQLTLARREHVRGSS